MINIHPQPGNFPINPPLLLLRKRSTICSGSGSYNPIMPLGPTSIMCIGSGSVPRCSHWWLLIALRKLIVRRMFWDAMSNCRKSINSTTSGYRWLINCLAGWLVNIDSLNGCEENISLVLGPEWCKINRNSNRLDVQLREKYKHYREWLSGRLINPFSLNLCSITNHEK